MHYKIEYLSKRSTAIENKWVSFNILKRNPFFRTSQSPIRNEASEGGWWAGPHNTNTNPHPQSFSRAVVGGGSRDNKGRTGW